MFIALTALAALAFSVGGYFMKLSAGFTQFRPTALVFGFFGLGAALQILAMRGEQMSVTYVVVLGLEAISACCLGIFLLNERSSITKLAGVGLVLAGVLLLRIGKS